MYKIVDKKELTPTVIQLLIEAPLVANKARPGQFIILRVDENGKTLRYTRDRFYEPYNDRRNRHVRRLQTHSQR